MVLNKRQFYTGLKRHKEGLIIGAITGALAANYVLAQGYDINTIVNAGSGLIDSVMGRSAPVEVATYKLYGAFIFIGSAFGFFSDMMIQKMRK